MNNLPKDSLVQIIKFLEINDIKIFEQIDTNMNNLIKDIAACNICNKNTYISKIDGEFVCVQCSKVCAVCNYRDYSENLFTGNACPDVMFGKCCTRYEHLKGKCQLLKCSECNLVTKTGRYMFSSGDNMICIKCAKFDVYCGIELKLDNNCIIDCEFNSTGQTYNNNDDNESIYSIHPYGTWNGHFAEHHRRHNSFFVHDFIDYYD